MNRFVLSCQDCVSRSGSLPLTCWSKLATWRSFQSHRIGTRIESKGLQRKARFLRSRNNDRYLGQEGLLAS